MSLFNRKSIFAVCLGLLLSLAIAACQTQISSDASVNEAGSTDCRMIQHTRGETCVPEAPKRLVVLGTSTLVNAMILGVKPVGTIVYYEETPPYLQGKVEDITLVGRGDEPNLETIVSLQPDLVIAMYDDGFSYERMSQIAPTVVDDWIGYPSWKEHFDFVAEVLNKESEAEQVWADYAQRIQSLKEALGDRYQATEISILRVCCDSWASDVQNSFSGTILEDAGLRRPPSQKAEEDGLVFFPEELITESIDGDIIFAIVDEDEASIQAFNRLREKPLWSKLNAVQQGRIYPVNLATWRGGNPLAADAVIDDLFKYLVEDSPPQSVSEISVSEAS
ncbi:Periplasmic binding protein [Synechococcus sp. PCC 7335]|uniref:ABC transporter substrate-binding protein n=1 Tax=Synechococcus sp. (strain ATCC 29403 / PCC 7335) TaxID=91464 RepID=UPI00017EE432|nr:iron-siderophore ABC transporter substrate-binding protein [Synechococcus sp. PCC 7335]EDX85247.1 Periplasmic binding protein [Synechococcus sp. PCC 7335]